MEEMNGNVKYVISMVGAIIAVGIWCGRMQAVQLEHSDQLKDFWGKYNKKSDEAKSWQIRAAIMESDLKNLKEEVRELKHNK